MIDMWKRGSQGNRPSSLHFCAAKMSLIIVRNGSHWPKLQQLPQTNSLSLLSSSTDEDEETASLAGFTPAALVSATGS